MRIRSRASSHPLVPLNGCNWHAQVPPIRTEKPPPEPQHLPPGVPPGAKLVDPKNLPSELTNDPALLQQLKAKGMLDDDSGGPGGGATKVTITPKGSETGRHVFRHEGRDIYEWDQSLEEVGIWIKPPPGVTSKHLDITIASGHLKVGIKGNPPFLDQATGGVVVVTESFWSISDGEISINLQKMKKGDMWASALVGHGELDPLTKEEDKKRLMLERFSEENPGFDFSNAEFNGNIPSARDFMGGVKYN